MANQGTLKTGARILLGVFLVLYGLNQFFHFLPTSYGAMPEDARDFIDGVAIFLPYLYIFEIIVGILLIFNFWTAFILIVLFPLSVSFLIFHFSNSDPGMMWPAIIVAGLNIYLLLTEREKYQPLFAS
jgi:uncharacterized membrane protein YphA (DoxX/SURF4 family)